jgi:hypothetical protein
MLVCGDRVTQATIIYLCDDAIAVKPKVASQSKFNAFASRANDVFHVRVFLRFLLSAYHAIGGSGGLE